MYQQIKTQHVRLTFPRWNYEMRNLQAKQVYNTRQCENVEDLLAEAKCYCEFTKSSVTQYDPGGSNAVLPNVPRYYPCIVHFM